MRTGRPQKRLDVMEVGALRRQGFSFTKIAEMLGVSRNTIVRRRQTDDRFKRLTNKPSEVPPLRHSGDKLVLVPLSSREYEKLRARAANECAREFTDWARRQLLHPASRDAGIAT